MKDVVSKALGPPPANPAYILSCISSYSLWTKARWEDAHLRAPDIVPPMSAVVKTFGYWIRAKDAAEKKSLPHIFDLYYRLSMLLKRKPKLGEARMAGVNVPLLLRHLHQSKQELDQLVSLVVQKTMRAELLGTSEEVTNV